MDDFNKGSEWRKWDLHVHTPFSLEHHYGQVDDETWEKYISDLEKLPSEYAVLGINDYIFLDGYRRVIKFKKEGRLRNIKTIFPVIELRIDKFGNIEDKAWKRVNLHIIFSDEVDVDTIESQFLNAIQVDYKLSPLDIEEELNVDFKGVITKESLQDLGKKIKESSSVEINGSDLKVGFNNFTHSYEQIKKALDSHYFKNKYLKAVGKTEWDTMRWTGIIGDKKTVINDADFIFISTENDISYLRARNQLIKQKVNSFLLDCSDAHFFSDSTNKDRIGNSLSWIKADPTFRGLQQVKQDFEERVFIGEKPAILDKVHLNKTKYIKKLDISSIDGYDGKKGIWFKDFGTLEFNKELIAIIGNKGNGKSAISDIIGLLANSSNQQHFSFLNKNKFLRNKLAENFEAKLSFESDGDELIKKLNDSIDESTVERVRYIPQNYFEKLCNDLEGEGFEKSLKQVVFTHLSEEDKLGKNSFEELIKYKTNSIKNDIDILMPKLNEVNNYIIELENKNNNKYERLIKEKFYIKWQEYKQHLKDKPKKVKKPNFEEGSEYEKKFLEIEKLRQQLLKKEYEKKSISEKISNNMKSDTELKILKSDFERLDKSIKSSLEKSNEIIRKYNLDSEKIFNYKINVNIIDNKIKEINNESIQLSKVLYDGEKNFGIEIDIKMIKEQIKKIESELSTVQKEYQFYLANIRYWIDKRDLLVGSEIIFDSIKGLLSECKYLKTKLVNDLELKREERFRITHEIFNKKSEVINIYKKLQESIDLMLKEYEELLENYSISINATFRLDNFENHFFSFISQNKAGSFYGKDDGKYKLKEILEDKDLTKFDDLKQILKEIINHLENDYRKTDGTKMIIEEQIKDYNEFYKYLFSLTYLMSNYELMLDGKILNALSPGEKGALLLVFYLMLDKEDIPLIIDQPEDNLDNQSVVKIVVEFMKRAKKRRQIFMVTHNPNLAVVADAEQIIYVNIDKQNNNKFTYKSGSIENLVINKSIVDILEGTLPAFGKRKNKYLI
jgi:ABC-type lipoprotein export system ATPase subunit